MATLSRILAIDDDQDILKLLGKYLGSKYHLDTAKSGQEALNFLASNTLPDI